MQPPKPHAAGVMFVTLDGRMLFVERSGMADDYPRTWCWPGGGIDRGETAKTAARREVREEVGFDMGRLRLGAPIDRAGGFHTFRVYVREPFDPRLNNEHTAFVWAKRGEVPHPLHPGVRATLDRLTAFEGITTPLVAADAAKPVKTFNPVRPAAGARTRYQKRLDAEIDEMVRSLRYWMLAAYKSDTPATVELAEDAAPSSVLQAAFNKLANRWQARFDALAPRLAEWFVTSAKLRVDASLQKDLRDAGVTVKFKMTRPMRDAYNAVIDENIGLIKSIAEQHLTQTRTALMQSVQNGRDLGYLAQQLEKRAGVTKRRAALIARDQNNKATAVMQRTRALELGVTRAKWVHSAGGKTPRPEHVKFSGQTYDIRKGHDFNNGEGVVWPGTAINCFPGHVSVSSGSPIRRVWRSFFNGPIVRIKVGADLLEGTFNHPVLTSRGWVPLGLLDDTDQIVRVVSDERRMVGNEKDQAVTSFSQLFETASACFGYSSRPSGGFDFYGDITDGDIDEIVIPEGFLPNGRQTTRDQGFENLRFPPTDSGVVSGIFGTLNEVSASNSTSGLRKGEPVIFGRMGHPSAHSRASVSHLSVSLQDIADGAGVMSGETQGIRDGGGAQALVVENKNYLGQLVPVDALVNLDAPFTEVLGQVVRAAADRNCSIFKLGPVSYELSGFIDKEIRDFSGHVYTLETADGCYNASNAFVQVRNCRCVSAPVIPGFE